MPSTSEIAAKARHISDTHDGKMLFNFKQIHEITGWGINSIPKILHRHGITVIKEGPSKKIDAFDLAYVICSNRIAPIDNTSKVKKS